MCLGVNIRRYFSSLDENKFNSNCWNTPSNLQKEIFPYVKQKEKKRNCQKTNYLVLRQPLCIFFQQSTQFHLFFVKNYFYKNAN